MLKITRAPNLIQPGLCYLELDGRQVGTVYAFEGCYDRIREALEERETTPEEGYLLEEKTRKLENAEMLIERLKREVKELDFSVALHDRSVEKARAIWEEAHPDAEFMPGRTELMVWLMDRVERAEAVKESLKASLMEISGFSAYWKCLRGNEEAWENVWNIATDALISLRTAEESSVVGLIDSTHAKQPEDSANTDGDGDILNDIETSLRAKTDGMKRLLESQTLSPELAALGRELVRLAEKSLGEVTE